MAKKITRKTPIPGRSELTVAEQGRLLSTRAQRYSLQNVFKYGYRNKEDLSNLPANTLVVGSQNVLTNAAELVGVRQGYQLDGDGGNQNDYGVDSSYDFETRFGSILNLRKWGTTLELRYMNPDTQTVSWVNILSTLTAANTVNFAPFWDQNTELKRFCLFVNGTNFVYEWSGGVGSVASATVATITLQGPLTTGQLGFYDNAANSGKFIITANGVDYTYTAVSGNTFTGVTPSPASLTSGTAVIQKVSSITGAGITTNGSGNMGTSVLFNLISTLKNQVWYGLTGQNAVSVSQTNNYKDVSYSTPARLPAQGALIVLDAVPVGFSPQASQMYIAAGTNQWWVSLENDVTIDVAGVATPTQTLSAQRLKSALNQSAQSQALITRFKNSLVFVSNEPIINALGQVQNINADPQVVNLSDPIKFDIDAYDFTGGCAFYDNYYIYVTVPVNGVVRMYNVQKNYWEAPQTIPISRFYHVLNDQNQTELFGHSSSTNESYQLFTGYNDNGNPINAVAAFPYVCTQGGSADMLKNFNSIYTEGYISPNTELLLEVNYDFGGSTGTYSVFIDGTESNILFGRVTDGSLGRNTLGAQPIGTILNLPFSPPMPKFRSINTMPRKDCFEYQIVYSSNDVDNQWTLLRFGPRIEGSQALPITITE